MSRTETPRPERSEGIPSSGILLVDKPAGFTSHDVVAIARGATGTRRIGHTGTLDPFATGLLVLLVGEATRLAQYIDGEPKVYDATIALGKETDTDDVGGTVVRDAPPPSHEAIEEAVQRLTGAIEQMPPAYSAKQLGGVRAYDAARKGTPLALEPSLVTVHEWRIRSIEDGLVSATIVCSGGTYIRSLGRDLGRLTDSAAHLATLRRVASGPFNVGNACSIDDLRARRYTLRPMQEGIASMPTQRLSPDDASRVAHGNAILPSVDGRRVALVTANGQLAAIAEHRGERLQPVTVFPSG